MKQGYWKALGNNKKKKKAVQIQHLNFYFI